MERDEQLKLLPLHVRLGRSRFNRSKQFPVYPQHPAFGRTVDFAGMGQQQTS
jgi:hypothetical protein